MGVSVKAPITYGGETWPTKRAATWALHERGTMSPTEIANAIGSTVEAVRFAVRDEKKRRGMDTRRQGKAARAANRPDATPGLWTPEKRDKVRRLFGHTMIHIADAVAVPPAELLKYVLHGVIPPSHKVARAEDIDWQADQAALPPPSPVPEPAILPRACFEGPETDPDVVDADHLVVVPSRDDDEAELDNFVETCALCGLPAPEGNVELDGDGEAMHPKCRREAEAAEKRDQAGRHPSTGKIESATIAPEVAPPAPVRFPPSKPANAEVATLAPNAARVARPDQVLCLMDEMGRYLHESLDGMTTNPRFAWKGGADKVKIIIQRLPHLKQLDQVAYAR